MNKVDMLNWDNFVMSWFHDDQKFINYYLNAIRTNYNEILYAGKNYTIENIEYNKLFGIVFNIDKYHRRVAGTAVTVIV